MLSRLFGFYFLLHVQVFFLNVYGFVHCLRLQRGLGFFNFGGKFLFSCSLFSHLGVGGGAVLRLDKFDVEQILELVVG